MCFEAPRPARRHDRQAAIGLTLFLHRLIGEKLGRDFYSVPALDMLLDLYLPDGHRSHSLSSLCGASDAPIRTALRTINRMVDNGLLARTPDPDDARRTNVTLTAKAIALLDAIFDAVHDRPA